MMEDLSTAYIQALSVKAGYSFAITDRRRDNHGIDVEIEPYCPYAPVTGQIRRKPKLMIQLKATYSHNFNSNGSISFPLDVDDYIELSHNESSILALYILPPDQNHWVLHSENELITKKCAYWLYLYTPYTSQPDPLNSSTISVQVNKTHILCADTINQMIENIRFGRSLDSGLPI